MHANRQGISLVLPSTQAPAKMPVKGEHKKKKKKVRKVASDYEESPDQDGTDTKTIGRIETITVGAAVQPSDESLDTVDD